jgi:very-short-patch-repair endonuclease
MPIRLELNAQHYIHRADLIDHGWRPDAIRRAVERDQLLVIRRKWIVSRAADPAVILAATAGGRVTCCTAASCWGIWRPDHHATHLALPPHAKGRGVDAVRHWSVGVVRPDERSLVDPLENVLATAARCLEFEDALAMWDSALNARKTTLEHLLRVPWRGARARVLLERACTLSDSGLETRFTTRMRRIGIHVRQQVSIAGHHVDGLIGERLVIQIDGYAHHHSPAQRRRDIAHDRRLRLLGYTVLRFDYMEIMHDWPSVEAQVKAAIAHGLHLSGTRRP